MKLADLQAMNLDELKRLAAAYGVAGASSLERSSLIDALARVGDPGGGLRAAGIDTVGTGATMSTVATAKANATGAGSRRPERRASGAAASGSDVEPLHRRHYDAAMPTSVLLGRPADHDSEAMARVYLEQGLSERAVEIYRELVDANPDDEELADLLAEAEARARVEARAQEPRRRRLSAAPHPPPAPHEPYGVLDLEELPDAYGVDEVEVIFKDPFQIFAYWEITDSGMSAARIRLGDEAGEARLVLRLFASTGVRAELSQTRDYPLEGWRGRRYLPTPKAGVRVRAATGLVAPSGLFALIAHSSVVRVPPSEPAPYEPRAVDWIEVRPSTGRRAEPEGIEIARHIGVAIPVPPHLVEEGHPGGVAGAIPRGAAAGVGHALAPDWAGGAGGSEAAPSSPPGVPPGAAVPSSPTSPFGGPPGGKQS